jgi:Signal peptide peptidase
VRTYVHTCVCVDPCVCTYVNVCVLSSILLAIIFGLVLALCLAIEALVFIRIPNLLVALVLLSLFFVYDMFWVFFSTYVFGDNVMYVRGGAVVCEETGLRHSPNVLLAHAHL